MFLNDCTGFDQQTCAAINICQARVNKPAAGAPPPEVTAACKAVMDEYTRVTTERNTAAVQRELDETVKNAAGALKK